MQQYVLVRNIALAKRLDLLDNITVGPVVRSAITAVCLMPQVDIVHIHDRSSQSAGLLLALTKSVPFVMTRHEALATSRNPLTQAACNRAAGFIEDGDSSTSEHLQVYRRAADSLRVPTILL